MKPDSIKWFDRLYLGSLAISIFGLALNWDSFKAAVAPDEQLGTTALVITFGIVFAVALAIWHFISNRGSWVAKWILIVFTAIGLAGILFGSSQYSLLDILATAMQVGSVAMLFRADAKAWFDDKDSFRQTSD